jgi:hypothetical protein
MYTFTIFLLVLLLSADLAYEESDLNGQAVYDVR